MAKRSSKTSTLNAAAEQIGAALGHFAAKIDALHQQRSEIAGELRRYIAGAEAMLASLSQSSGHKGGASRARAITSARRGRPPGFKMTEEAREKMREAWKRRRQEMKVAEKGIGKKGTHAKRAITKPMTEKL